MRWKQAGLWRDPDLQLALNWRDQNQPNAAWAAPYHPAFGPAMRFLEESSAAREAEVSSDRKQKRNASVNWKKQEQLPRNEHSGLPYKRELPNAYVCLQLS